VRNKCEKRNIKTKPAKLQAKIKNHSKKREKTLAGSAKIHTNFPSINKMLHK
jgi:hypothetical protein